MIIAWLAFAAFFFGMGAAVWHSLKGADDFPGTEAGLCGCFMVLVFAIGNIVIVTSLCAMTFEGRDLIVAIISGVGGVVGSVFLLLHLDRMDYDRRTLRNWNGMTPEEQQHAVRFKPRYNHLKPKEPNDGK